MSTETITLHYNGSEFQITDWERGKIRTAHASGTPTLLEISPLDDEMTPVEIALGPGIAFHFSTSYSL